MVDDISRSGDGQRRSRVLVVEDEEEVRELWLDVLGQAGYNAVGVGDGREAVARVHRGSVSDDHPRRPRLTC